MQVTGSGRPAGSGGGRAVTTVMVALILAVPGCGGAVAQASRGPMLVSPADLAAEIERGVLVLHVHDREDAFEAGHIPGARFVRYSRVAVDDPGGPGAELPPMAELQRILQEAGVRARERVVVYSTSPLLAARMFYTLDVTGHPDVALLDGGLAAWKADGRPMESGPAKAAATGDFVPRLDESRLATADWIRARLGSPDLSLIDVRPDPEYTGSGGDRAMGSPGHLPGARQLTWNSLVQDDGTFLPREALAARLAAAGAVADRPIVTYCMVGMRASVVYFVARYLGMDARLYDGSIIDWGRKGLPVVRGTLPGQG